MTTALAHPNIALIKYWGKRDAVRNLPAVDSLSITLDSLETSMSVVFDPRLDEDRLTVNGSPAPSMLPRVSRCLDSVAGSGRAGATIDSHCNFPLGAGLASSASSFAALVLAADRASGGSRGKSELATLAGAASGSAARSLFGGFVRLTANDEHIEVEQVLRPDDWPLEVIVAVTEAGEKPVGSTEAMERGTRTSPFYSSWVARQRDDLEQAMAAVRQRDFEGLAAVAEHNCLKMHSIMWTSRPPVVYWNHATLACLHTVRDLQRSGHGVFFTMDAGPQVKAVCLPGSAAAVRQALESVDGVEQTMQSGLGRGARLVDE